MPFLFCFTQLFLSTPSARRATGMMVERKMELEISIHALREEGDDPVHAQRLHRRNFYPRPPRGGRLVQINLPTAHLVISIHALREEGDSASTMRWTR